MQEQFGYAYDAAWNLNYRTNNAMVQTFAVNNLNELTNVTRSGTFTVAGTATEFQSPYYPINSSGVVVSGTGLTTGSANLYADLSWAAPGATLANGTNTYTATVTDTLSPTPRTATDTVTVYSPATVPNLYDLNGNLRTNATQVFEYDDENELTAVMITNDWRSEFAYDGKMRRRIERDYQWQNSAWLETNETHYVYDGDLVIQERNSQNLPLVTYTRGNDLSKTLQGAGGIGGLLARTDNSLMLAGSIFAHILYFADANGNITCMVATNGNVEASYNYDSFGSMQGMSGPLAAANTYRFSSKEIHPASGLYYYGRRYYQPNLQRWLNRDPIEEGGGINLYEFVGNNPESQIDPLGLGFGGVWHPNQCPLKPNSCVQNCMSQSGGGYAAAALIGASGTVGTIPKPYGAGALGSGGVTTGFSIIQNLGGPALRQLGRKLNPVGDAVSCAAGGYLVGLAATCECMCANDPHAF